MMAMDRSNWRAVCVLISTVAVLVSVLWTRDVRSSDKDDQNDEDRALVALLWFRGESSVRLGGIFRKHVEAIQKDPSIFHGELNGEFGIFIFTAWRFEKKIELYKFDDNVVKSVRKAANKFDCNSAEDVLNNMKERYRFEDEETKKELCPELFDETSESYASFREFLSRVFEQQD